MKKLLLNLFLVLGILTLAQNKRFIYEYKFTHDQKNASNIETEMMFLDTTKDGSKYYSYTVLNSDSLIKADIERQMKVNDSAYVKPNLQKGIVRYSVTKTYPDYKVNLHKSIGMYAYKIPENRKINWKILSEKEKIGEWNAQKAEVDFAGRHWIAWFSTDIPIQDGPYKFHGLAGLIIKIEDKTSSYQIELKGIENLNKNIDINGFEKKQIIVSPKKFQKLLNDQKNRTNNQIKTDSDNIELDNLK